MVLKNWIAGIEGWNNIRNQMVLAVLIILKSNIKVDINGLGKYIISISKPRNTITGYTKHCIIIVLFELSLVKNM